AALDGVALARVPRHAVQEHLASGTLAAVLEDWRPRSVGFYLYYPSRRQMPAALQALIDMLKSELSARRTNGPSQPGAAPTPPTALRGGPTRADEIAIRRARMRS